MSDLDLDAIKKASEGSACAPTRIVPALIAEVERLREELWQEQVARQLVQAEKERADNLLMDWVDDTVDPELYARTRAAVEARADRLQGLLDETVAALSTAASMLENVHHHAAFAECKRNGCIQIRTALKKVEENR